MFAPPTHAELANSSIHIRLFSPHLRLRTGNNVERETVEVNAATKAVAPQHETMYCGGMTEPTITLTEDGSKGRYVTRPDPDGPEAELTYSRASAHLIIIDHTGVPDAYRGQKVGVALVRRAVEDARSGGYKILPLCPFAAAQFRRHKEWADVLNG